MAEKFVNYYEKEKPQRLFIHKTYSKQVAGKRKDIDSGDITEPKTIKLFSKEIDEKADLITADGGFNWTNETIQEQEAYRLLLGEILACLTYQKEGGSFVIKIFESLTGTTMKIIALLRSLYEKVYAIKPLTSRPSNSEKYLVCKNFIGDEKSVKIIRKKIAVLLDKIHDTGLNIVDLYPEINISDDFIMSLKYLNLEIENKQIVEINKIVSFIEKSVYYGDEYNEYRRKQIEANDFWNNKFLKNKKDKVTLSDEIEHLTNKNNEKIKMLRY
jgi:hypothetical protein